MTLPRTVAVACLLTALAVAGCFGGTDDKDGQGQTPGPTLAPTTAMTALGQPVLVSAPEHRVAEFMVNRDPQDPQHLVTAYGDYDSPGGVLNCAFSVTKDGGKTWTVSAPVPGFSAPYLQFDGWVDFDEWGGVHAICIEQAGADVQTAEAWPYYFRSSDGGLTWSEAQHIPTDPPGRSTDKTVLGVGRDGTVYGAVSGIVGTTRDNGTNWVPMSELKEMKDGRLAEVNFASLNGFVEGNDGTMFLIGGGPGAETWVERTTDHGTSWTHAVAGEYHIPPGYSDQNRWVRQEPWTTLPVIAHDELSDEVWVAGQDWDTAANGYVLHLWRSTDNGVSFEEVPTPRFADPSCTDPCHVTHPGIAFDPQGRLGLTVQLTKDGGVLKVVQFTVSGDHGQTWLPPMTMSKTDGMQSWQNPEAFRPLPENAVNIAKGMAADPGTGVKGAATGIALTSAVAELQMRWNGEYWGLGASNEGFVVMWIDHSNNGRPHLYSQVVQVS